MSALSRRTLSSQGVDHGSTVDAGRGRSPTRRWQPGGRRPGPDCQSRSSRTPVRCGIWTTSPVALLGVGDGEVAHEDEDRAQEQGAGQQGADGRPAVAPVLGQVVADRRAVRLGEDGGESECQHRVRGVCRAGETAARAPRSSCRAVLTAMRPAKSRVERQEPTSSFSAVRSPAVGPKGEGEQVGQPVPGLAPWVKTLWVDRARSLSDQPPKTSVSTVVKDQKDTGVVGHVVGAKGADVPPERIELPTPSLGRRRSIH